MATRPIVLTPRQRAVIDRLLTGEPRKAIAADLGISVRQVTRHLHTVRAKISARSTLHLAVMLARFQREEFAIRAKLQLVHLVYQGVHF